MKLYLLYTRATARGRWHRNANSASLSKHECIAAVYNPTWYQGSSSVESTFQRAAVIALLRASRKVEVIP